MREVKDKEKLLELLENKEKKNLFIFKHSTRCPVSAMTIQEFRRFAEQNSGVECVVIDIIGNRELSNFLAEKSGVKHESPQVIQYHNGVVTWHASHGSIVQPALEQHIHRETST